METRTTYATETPKPEKNSGEYTKLADEWLEATDSKLHIEFDRTGKYFDDDKEERDIYKVTLSRGRHKYTFTFGQCVAQSARFVRVRGSELSSMPMDPYEQRRNGWKGNPNRAQPDAYSILACLEKYNPGTFEEWCAEFGYDTDSRKAEKTYRAVCEQFLSLSRMYTYEELAKLAEIQ